MGAITVQAIRGSSTRTAPIEVVSQNEAMIVGGHWTDTAGNKISKTLVTDTVRFHLQTKNADGRRVRIVVFVANPIRRDTPLLQEQEVRVVNNQAVLEIRMRESLRQNVRDGQGNSLNLYCQCRFSDSDNIVHVGRSPSQYLQLFEVGYYRDDHCRVIMDVINGEIHWVPENSKPFIHRNFREFVENPDNWTWTGNRRDVGVRDARLLGFWAWNEGEVIDDKILFRGFQRNPTQARIFTLNSCGNSPTNDDRQLKIMIVIARSTGLPDKRVRQQRTTTTALPGGRSTAGGVVGLAVAGIVGTLEIAPIVLFRQDKRLVRRHLKTLLADVRHDIFSYLDDNRLPAHMNNWETIFLLSNLVLCGNRGATMSNELFEIGKTIYRNYSEFRKG